MTCCYLTVVLMINSSMGHLVFSHQQGSHVLIGKALSFDLLSPLGSWVTGGDLNAWATVPQLYNGDSHAFLGLLSC